MAEMNPLTLEELRGLEEKLSNVCEPDHEYPEDIVAKKALRAVRELIEIREAPDYGMPWRALHKNTHVKLLNLEEEYARLRKVAEEAADTLQCWDPGTQGRARGDRLRAALKEGSYIP